MIFSSHSSTVHSEGATIALLSTSHDILVPEHKDYTNIGKWNKVNVSIHGTVVQKDSVSYTYHNITGVANGSQIDGYVKLPRLSLTEAYSAAGVFTLYYLSRKHYTPNHFVLNDGQLLLTPFGLGQTLKDDLINLRKLLFPFVFNPPGATTAAWYYETEDGFGDLIPNGSSVIHNGSKITFKLNSWTSEEYVPVSNTSSSSKTLKVLGTQFSNGATIDYTDDELAVASTEAKGISENDPCSKHKKYAFASCGPNAKTAYQIGYSGNGCKCPCGYICVGDKIYPLSLKDAIIASFTRPIITCTSIFKDEIMNLSLLENAPNEFNIIYENLFTRDSSIDNAVCGSIRSWLIATMNIYGSKQLVEFLIVPRALSFLDGLVYSDRRSGNTDNTGNYKAFALGYWDMNEHNYKAYPLYVAGNKYMLIGSHVFFGNFESGGKSVIKLIGDQMKYLGQLTTEQTNEVLNVNIGFFDQLSIPDGGWQVKVAGYIKMGNGSAYLSPTI